MSKDFPIVAYFNLWLFGIAFGLIEAAVVVYLRTLFGQTGDSLFPLVAALQPQNAVVVRVELYRELATLVLMLVPAHFFARQAFTRFLGYLVVFGVWDLSYYVFLKAFLHWPPTLQTYDVLFMVPTVWVAPVVCPVLISIALIGFSTVYLYLIRIRMPRSPTALHWLLAILGGALVLYSFVNEADYYLQGGLPPRFSWAIFLVGFLLAAGSGFHFLIQYARQPKTRFL
jgi:hypothetical protein